MKTASTARALLCLAVLWAPASAQEGDPAAAALAELERIVDAIPKTPVAEQDPILARAFDQADLLLERHLDALTERQLDWVGALWFQLAARRGDAAALEAQAARLRGRRELPPRLRQAVERSLARVKLRPGAPAPVWKALDVRQDRWAPVLAEGRPTLVVFWTSWCPPCRRLLAERLRLLAAERGEQLALVCVGLPGHDESAAGEAAFAAQQGYGWTFLFDEGGKCAEAYGVSAHPTLVLVDAEGEVLLVGPAWQTIDRVREALPVPAAPAESPAADPPAPEEPAPPR